MFSAQLRLSTAISYKEKQGKVDQVIRELDLECCSDSRVGKYLHTEY